MLDILLGQAQSVRRGQVGCIDVEQGLHRGQGAGVCQALGNVVVDLQRSTQQQVTSDATTAPVPTLGRGQVPGSGGGGSGQLSMGGSCARAAVTWKLCVGAAHQVRLQGGSGDYHAGVVLGLCHCVVILGGHCRTQGPRDLALAEVARGPITEGGVGSTGLHAVHGTGWVTLLLHMGCTCLHWWLVLLHGSPAGQMQAHAACAGGLGAQRL